MEQTVRSALEAFPVVALLGPRQVGKTTTAQAEIDLVLEGPHRRVLALEVKRTLTPKVSKGFYLGCEDIGATERYYVIPEGERYPLGHDTEAIALRDLVRLIDSGLTTSRSLQ